MKNIIIEECPYCGSKDLTKGYQINDGAVYRDKIKKNYITNEEKLEIIKMMISKGYLTENQIRTLKKRNNL